MLEINTAAPVRRLLVEEIQILLAGIQARIPDHQEHENLLNKINPLDLYLACLDIILEKYGKFHKKTAKYDQFLKYLHSQKLRLKAADLIRKPILPIDKLFEIKP